MDEDESIDELLESCSVSTKSLYNMTKKLEKIQLDNIVICRHLGESFISKTLLDLINELELAKITTETKELQIKSFDFNHTTVEDILNGIESINNYSLDRDTQITNIKSQLKHCKNPLQKLNMEREMNRLIRERGMR